MTEILLREEATFCSQYSAGEQNFTVNWDCELTPMFSKFSDRDELFGMVYDEMLDIGSFEVFLSYLQFKHISIRWSSEFSDEDGVITVYVDTQNPLVVL